MRCAIAALWVLASTLTAGCATDRWYVDPENVVVRYEDLAPPATRARFRVRVTMLVEGQRLHSQRLQLNLSKRVMEVIGKSGLIEVSRSIADPELDFRLDADPRNASDFERHGPGARIEWVQEMIVYADTDKGLVERRYSQSILVFRGKAQEPDGLPAPMQPRAAHDQVVESMVLLALRDFQRDGLLPVAETR